MLLKNALGVVPKVYEMNLSVTFPLNLKRL